MKFKALAKNETDFHAWVKKVRESEKVLDASTYESLGVKSKDHPVEYYSQVNPLMFNRIIEKYTGPQNGE